MVEIVRGKKRSDKCNFFKTIFSQAKCLSSYKGGAGGRHHQQLNDLIFSKFEIFVKKNFDFFTKSNFEQKVTSYAFSIAIDKYYNNTYL